MKNRQRITHSHQEVLIYRDYYRPSFNLLRFFRSIFGVLIFGSSSVANHYAPLERKRMK